MKDKFGKSLYIGTYAGIPIFLHWSFGFVLLFIAYHSITEQLDFKGILWLSASVLTVFLCVILHEYGHALTARKYGVKTKDIIISPLGGVARLESMPQKPLRELLIALAGPAVNVVIAILLLIFFTLIFEENFVVTNEKELETINGINFVRLVISLNIALFIFNLIPAFPMDGGRILRSLLAMKLGRVRATKIASNIGKVIAVLLIAYAVWFVHPTLIFIGGFVYLMAGMENRQTEIQGKLKDTQVSEIMDIDYTMIFEEDLMEKPLGFFRNGVSKSFMVFDYSQERVVGALPELFLREYEKTLEIDQISVKDLMSDSIGFFQKDVDLEFVFKQMNDKAWSLAGIKNGEQLIGMVDRHLINSFLRKP